MPSTIRTRTYTHHPDFTVKDYSLRPHRADEHRFLPRAYAPTSGTATIEKHNAEFIFRYTIDETPNRQTTQLGDGVVATFGKYTRKLLLIVLTYESVDEVNDKLAVAIRGLKSQKQAVPQDSIKRNYHMSAKILEFLGEQISNNMLDIKASVAVESPE